ncbi:nicotinate-nucleotide adenylyltransferase [Ruegeria sp. ANG-S4]|uniref:nicotinate-nucleotide adenylyltransferase n=1 Tax=Ruegeria sp. ANG-S4 TaxID=1577904 RepID=UPI00058008A5|nr:nicotinate-nucleotide adenylyltransferase [Ruegeria sp. ANG-S4]KIC46612.1 nicotinate-nucleotide adenylyltransferase [Ruegeria sp. ANG-S4]
MDRYTIPYASPGQVIGLFGGSFDPPHQGHVHVTLEAMKAFGLDRVWWLVSPGNPLKTRGPAPLAQRMQAAQAVMRHPRVEVTDIEALTGTRATADTLTALQRLYPRVRFVWLMGADNLAQFHKWKDWRLIMDSVPVGVLARPGDRISARMSPAARLYAKYRIDGRARHLLGRARAPAWCFVNVPMVDVSSTDLRNRGVWGDGVLPE